MASGFVALRSPLLPFATLEDWARGFGAANRPGDRAAWERDRRIARLRLQALLEVPEVREAIFLASPSLEERHSVWLGDPEGEAGGGIEAGLVKYIVRMAARCTPFGLFAGSSLGSIGREASFELWDRGAGVRHTRLDMELLSEVVARLVANPDIQPRLRFLANSSLYEVAGALRYAEARIVEGRRSYFLVDVEPNAPLRAALARARAPGGATLDEIASELVDEDIPFDAARSFAAHLVEVQLLVADLGPVVTGPESLDHLVDRLRATQTEGDALEILAATRDALVDMDAEGVGVPPSRYRLLAESFAPVAPVSLARFVQVDLTKPAQRLVLPEDLVEELKRGAQALLDLFGHGRQDRLEPFRRSFEERYGDREIPLVEALDEEIGIGFEAAQSPGTDPSPLLAGLPFPPREEAEQVAWGARARFLEWKLAEAIEAGREELVLDAGELARFHDPGGARLANAIHIHASVLAPNPRDPSAPRAVLESAAGPSGARLLGRFCHGDPELYEHVLEHLRAEESLQPEVAYFEIVHLPEGRTGNVLARPLLRRFELAFLGTSGAPLDRTLSIDDLTIRLESNRVILRSRSLDREVRPRLTTAHNTAWRSLGVYRFLAALQAEGLVEGVQWSWGPLESQPRLPRVRYGGLVLSRQMWNARKAEAERLVAARGHDAFRTLQAWRSERRIPRWVGLVDADNVLPVDLDNALSTAALLDELRGSEGFTLQEMFPGARPDAVDAPEGRFVNEVIVPLVRRTNDAPAPRRAALRPNADSFGPGSSWLTVKLYAGPAVADRLLLDVVAPIAHAALDSGAVDRWFFIRYGDPDWHLRVRLHGDASRLLAEVLPAFGKACEPSLTEGRLHRMQLDTYTRETYRYGGADGILLAEDLFHRDSEAVLAFLASAPGDEGLDARWRFAFLGMDRLSRDLGLDDAAQLALFRTLAKSFGEEFHIDSNLRRRVMERFRRERRSLEDLLEERGPSAEPLSLASPLLGARSRNTRSSCEAIGRLAAQEHLTVRLEELVASLMHMHANRVFRSAHRSQEMVLYHFLESAAASRVARSKATRAIPA